MSNVVTATSPLSAPHHPAALDWRLRFEALSLVWGFSFLFIKVGSAGRRWPRSCSTPCRSRSSRTRS